MPQPHSTASPLHRFVGEKKRGDKDVFWGRAGTDGLPILGAPRGAYGDEEFSRKMVPTKYFQFATFDLSEEADRLKFTAVMDKLGAGVFQLVYRERLGDPASIPVKWYVEWYEVYLQDGSMADAILES